MSQGALKAQTIEHEHLAAEICPYCDQAIPNERAGEIRARFDAKWQREEADLKARLTSQLDAERKTEIAQLNAAHVEALQKVTNAASEQQAAALEEGKRIAAAESQHKLDEMAASQTAANLKLQELEKQKLAAEALAQTVTTERDAVIAARTAEVRSAMEQNKADAIAALKSEHAEETTKFAAQIDALRKQIDSEASEGVGLDLYQELKKKFPKDEITKINKSAGADIEHTVKRNNHICGKILYDSRNRNAWKGDFAANLQKDMVAAKADHAILTTGKFPGGAKHICITDGVIAATPPRAIVLSEILREQILRNHAQRVSAQDKQRKTAKLYEHITSDAFAKFLKSLQGNDEKLLRIDEEEKAEHTKTWKKRGLLLTENQRLHGNLQSEIDRIINSHDQD